MFRFTRKLSSGRNKPGRKATYQLQVEALEQRDLLSAMGGLLLDGDTEPAPAEPTEPAVHYYSYETQGETAGTVSGSWTNVLDDVVGGTTGTYEDPGPQPTAAGLARINSLPDANVRARALAAYQSDGMISRNDMIDIFFYGSVGYTDLTNTALNSMDLLLRSDDVAMHDYVRVLAAKVLEQYPMDSSSPAQTLKTSVDNFFLGLNRPQSDNFNTYTQVNKPLFVNGVNAADVDNGFLTGATGFNWFLASVEEVAWRTPGEIQRMFIDNGDQTYTVAFDFLTRMDYVTVDNYLLDPGPGIGDGWYYGAGSSEMWVHMLMKAYVQLNEEGQVGSLQPGVNSYEALRRSPLPDGKLPPVNPAWVFSRLAGGFHAYTREPTSIDALKSVSSFWGLGWYIALETKSTDTHELIGNNRWYAMVNYVPDPAQGGRFTFTQDGKRFVEVAGSVLMENFGRWVAQPPFEPSTAAMVPDNSAPAVTDLRLPGTKAGISSVVLNFSKALDPASAEDPTHYRLTAPGKDGRFGTADDKVIPLGPASYDDAGHTVSLTPLTPLKLGKFYQVTASDVTDLAGKALDQDADGTADPYVTSFAKGKKLAYTDADGDRVSLALRLGGMMELTRGPDGEGSQLRLVDTVAGRSVLKGTVKQKMAESDGATGLASLMGTQNVDVSSLTAVGSRFRIEALDVAVLDSVFAASLSAVFTNE